MPSTQHAPLSPPQILDCCFWKLSPAQYPLLCSTCIIYLITCNKLWSLKVQDIFHSAANTITCPQTSDTILKSYIPGRKASTGLILPFPIPSGHLLNHCSDSLQCYSSSVFCHGIIWNDQAAGRWVALRVFRLVSQAATILILFSFRSSVKYNSVGPTSRQHLHQMAISTGATLQLFIDLFWGDIDHTGRTKEPTTVPFM